MSSSREDWGHWDEWVRGQMCPWNESTCAAAAEGGPGCPWDKTNTYAGGGVPLSHHQYMPCHTFKVLFVTIVQL